MINRLLEFMGNSAFQALTSSINLYHAAPRVQVLTPDQDNLDVVLPDTADLRLGGPHFYIINLSDTFFFNVKSHNDFDIFQIDPEKGIVLSAFRSDGQKRWFGKIFDLAGTAIGKVA